jgi:hypothetical protein
LPGSAASAGAARRVAAFSRATLSQLEEPSSVRSTGGCTTWMRSMPPGIRSAPSQASTQTQRIHGFTSQ